VKRNCFNFISIIHENQNLLYHMRSTKAIRQNISSKIITTIVSLCQVLFSINSKIILYI
jgi:hypothetical protein